MKSFVDTFGWVYEGFAYFQNKQRQAHKISKSELVDVWNCKGHFLDCDHYNKRLTVLLTCRENVEKPFFTFK